MEGGFVKKGDLLFELDPSKFKAALDQAQGDLAKTQAQLMKTKLDVERDTPLAKQGAISKKNSSIPFKPMRRPRVRPPRRRPQSNRPSSISDGPGSRRRSTVWSALPRLRSAISSMPTPR